MGRHLLSLVNDILEMSKVEAGESQLNESAFAVGQPLEDSVRTVTAAYRDRSAAVLLDRDAALPRLRGDRRMFPQTVMTLLSNSIQYSPGRGEVPVPGAG